MSQVKIIYQDKDLLVADKPPGIITFRQQQTEGNFLIEVLAKEHPEIKKPGAFPRYGAIHRLDKDTSGIVLVAKNNNALKFFQKEFKERRVIKEYIALCVGEFKEKEGTIETNIGRSPKDRRKQKAFPLYDPKNPRLAVTRYQVLKNFENYTLIKVVPETGRKHQIRCHLSHIKKPIAGDSLYGFKNQACPKSLNRHFLHAQGLRINTLSYGYKSFFSEMPDDLQETLKELENKI